MNISEGQCEMLCRINSSPARRSSRPRFFWRPLPPGMVLATAILVLFLVFAPALPSEARPRAPYEELARQVLEEQALHIPPVDPSTLERGAPLMESLFLAANASFSYHLRVRELSFIRDKVSLDHLPHWTTEKMRELFLVPSFGCPMSVRVGEWGEGGKWLCNIFPFRGSFRRSAVEPSPSLESDGANRPLPGFTARLDLSRRPVVYSIGSRDETSFEMAMHRLMGVMPHTFDPSLSQSKQRHMESLPFLRFHNIGLKGRGRTRVPQSWGSLMRITEVMEMLQHVYVDVLKIDCERCEFGVMKDLLETFGRQPPVGQVLMEIHDLVSPRAEIELLLVMEQLGFRMFHSENNERYLKAHELAYIHESLVDPAFWP